MSDDYYHRRAARRQSRNGSELSRSQGGVMSRFFSGLASALGLPTTEELETQRRVNRALSDIDIDTLIRGRGGRFVSNGMVFHTIETPHPFVPGLSMLELVFDGYAPAGTPRDQYPTVQQRMSPQPQVRRARPSRSVIDRLPRVPYHKTSSERSTCVICLEEFREGQDTTLLPCLHSFHTSCISDHLNYQQSCPICRYELD
ncbi:hypothetical protein RCL1_006644 [Eukaryota sp. TZLM3-RCL]